MANLAQKALGFILLPLYTRLLTPEDYGVLAVVTSIGIVLTVVFSLGASALLIIVGGPLLRPILGGVAFFPFVALGLVVTAFQPVYDTLLMFLQTTERSLRFGVVSLLSFVMKEGLTIGLVAGFGLGAFGALAA